MDESQSKDKSARILKCPQLRYKLYNGERSKSSIIGSVVRLGHCMANGMRFSIDKLPPIASNRSPAGVEHRVNWSGRTEACIRDCLSPVTQVGLVFGIHARSNAILHVKWYLPRFSIHERSLEKPCHYGSQNDWTARLAGSRNTNLSISVSMGR